MRILLIYPAPPRTAWPRGRFLSRWVPSGVAQIAAQLRRAGHDARVHVREEHLAKLAFDWDAADRRLRALLTEFRPDIVGLSAVTATMGECASTAALARELLGDGVLIVAGGPHPTALPEQTLKECPAVDVVGIGEGEATMLELAQRGPAPEVAGLAYRDGDGVVRTAPRKPWADLDALEPLPHDLFDMDWYASRDRWLIRWLPLRATNLRTSRGCPGRCRFCAGHVAAGLGVRFHSPEYVLDQMARAIDRFGVEAILFEDETLGADADRLRAICAGVRRRGWHTTLRWSGCLRVDQADPELLAEMKSAGCVQIEYGFESGSDRMLRGLSKNASVEQNRRAVRLTREAGIRIFANIMVGLPGETVEDFRATERFLRWARPEILSAARLVPLPGTPIYDELPPWRKAALNWDGYAYPEDPGHPVNLTAMTDAEFERLYRDFHKYTVRPTLQRHLLRDAPADAKAERRRLRRTLVSFAIRHPLRAARLPR